MKRRPARMLLSLTLSAAFAASVGAGCAIGSDADSGASTASGNSAQQLQEADENASNEAGATAAGTDADATKSKEANKTSPSAKKSSSSSKAASNSGMTAQSKSAAKTTSKLKIKKIYSAKFKHGKKSAKQTKYIVLHDTEVAGASAAAIAQSWKGGYVAAHFVVGRNGSIVQCVPLDRIAHHTGYGDKGHNKKYGVSSKRDDMRGAKSIGKSYPDYGMNACSVGIEICHASGESYTAKQLKALDKLIAYIDTKLGKQCKVIDHKAWRSTNSDTSKAFAKYLKNYKKKRHH